MHIPTKAILKPSSSATRRTKNRIREHGPVFELHKDGIPGCFNTKAILASSGDWLGWLPLSEIVIEKE